MSVRQIDVEALRAATPENPRRTALQNRKTDRILVAMLHSHPTMVTVLDLAAQLTISEQHARSVMADFSRRGWVAKRATGKHEYYRYGLTPVGMDAAEKAICPQADSWKRRYERGATIDGIAHEDNVKPHLVREVLEAQDVAIRRPFRQMPTTRLLSPSTALPSATPPSATLLEQVQVVLLDQRRPMRIRDIRPLVFASTGDVTSALDKLVRDGLASAQRRDESGRTLRVNVPYTLTPQGVTSARKLKSSTDVKPDMRTEMKPDTRTGTLRDHLIDVLSKAKRPMRTVDIRDAVPASITEVTDALTQLGREGIVKIRNPGKRGRPFRRDSLMSLTEEGKKAARGPGDVT